MRLSGGAGSLPEHGQDLVLAQDQVLDAVGLDTLLPDAEELVAPGGSYVEIETLISRADEERVARAAERGVRIVSNMIAVQRQPQHMMELAALCTKGAIRPPETEVLPLANYWPAEDYHQDFFERNPYQGYCMAVAAPKVAKFRKTFSRLAKS